MATKPKKLVVDEMTLRLAVIGGEVEKARLDAKLAELRKELGMDTPQKAVPASEGAPTKKRELSAEARKRIADAQKRRWAAHRKRAAAAARAAKKAK